MRIPISLPILHSLALLLLSTFLILLHQFLYRFRLLCKHSCRDPPTYLIIGCLISFYKNRHRLLDWYTDLLANSPTQTILVRRLGARRTIVTANPDNVEYILRANFNNFPKGKPFSEILGDFLGCGIFNVDGELWLTQRKLACHEFSPKYLREYIVKTLKEQVEKRLLPELESAMITGDAIDIQELLRVFAFDTVCKVSLGTDDPLLPLSSLAKAFDAATEISAKRATAPIFAVWKIKRSLSIGSERKLKEAIEQVREFVVRIIRTKKKQLREHKEERSNINNNGDLLSRLIMAEHEEVVIRDMVISFLMAGKDTTSAAMTWLFWLLSRHPDIEKNVVKEITRLNVNNKSSPGFEALKEMRLLKACLCESMRLYPPIAWDSKHAVGNDTLPDGTPVRTGDRVTYFPYGMGRMEELWGKDRYEFKPDRWFIEPDQKRGELKKVSPYRFPVFQAGPRVCLGKEMAFIQMKYVVAWILSRFELRPVGSDQPVFVPFLTAHMAGGFKVLVSRGKKEKEDKNELKIVKD